MSEKNFRESLLNRINGSHMTRTVLLRQVGFKWRLESYTETFNGEGRDLITKMTCVVPHTTDGSFPSRNIQTPAPPLPSTREEWDKLVGEWEDGGRVDFFSFKGVETLDTVTRDRYIRRQHQDEETQREWVELMKETWKKVHGEEDIPVGARVTIEDLNNTMTPQQKNILKW